MKLLVVSIRDVKTDAFMQPFFTRTKPEAIRAFSDAINDPKSQFAQHPDDYSLYLLGEFDDSSGALVCADQTDRLITGLECVRKD
uniref:DNA binding protein VP5 n=1 Tax=Gokushovirinae environmental samples TaxID=1478972 RepID=A0A2R3UAI6_9VIRU|nr:DNA binding protein VP5 [Gokushovirinae environmental samples]